jgi:hypothetical protein
VTHVNRSSTLLAVALLLPLGGCPLLQVEAEVPEVCVSRTDVTVPGSLGQLQTKVRVDLSEIDGLSEIQGSDELHFISFSAHPQDSGLEFASIQSAKVTLRASEASGLPDLQVFACSGNCITSEGSLTVKSSTDANIADYLGDAEVSVEIELHGSLPLRDFKVDVNACLSGALTRSL